MQRTLPQKQRIVVAVAYLIILTALFILTGGNLRSLALGGSIDSSLWYYSGAFMIILGSYIVEPLFTKPSDAIANSTAVLIALISLTDKQSLILYLPILCYVTMILVLSVLTISLKDTQSNFLKNINKFIYFVVEVFGSSKFIFSVVYLAAIYSYLGASQKIVEYSGLLAFWICLVFFDVVGIIVSQIAKLINYFSKEIGTEIGHVIGCENPLFYQIEVDVSGNSKCEPKYGDLIAIETSLNIGAIGVIVGTKHLLNKKWFSAYLLQDEDGDLLKINIKDKKLVSDAKSIFSQENLAYAVSIDSLPEEVSKKILTCTLYKDGNQFVGYVASGSNITTINFCIVRESDDLKERMSEGAILQTSIYGKETLYQVINGNTKDEHLENFDHHGYIVGVARKLGVYNTEKKELDVRKWMPSAFSPLFFAYSGMVSEAATKEIAKNAIGRLPDTELEIPLKDINAIVTHNTAILGILGIGKSCLAYELIRRVSDAGIKVVCIDITNEYAKELPSYFLSTSIKSDELRPFPEILSKYEYIHYETPSGDDRDRREVPDKSGNIEEYRNAINKSLRIFLFGVEDIPDSNTFSTAEKVRIYNVDYHKVSKGEKIGFRVITTDLTQAEKTRVISEELFKILMKIPLSEEKKAKVLFVLEEAHSLIPEWNSVSNEGDKNATNGTAKIILQGRKYGLGSLVVTQRTANVSKSVLNQCNTIFALRVFDDTGKGFLA